MADNDTVSVEFNITGVGWAVIVLRIGAQTYTTDSLSDLTDVLGDLVRAALTLATGGNARVSFDGEPVETRFVLTNLLDGIKDTGSVAITILTFASYDTRQDDANGHKEFYGDCDVFAFGRAVLACAKRVEAGFAWDTYPYPARAVHALEAALAFNNSL